MSDHEWDYCDVTDEDIRCAVAEFLLRLDLVPQDVEIELYLAEWGDDNHSVRWHPTDWVPVRPSRNRPLLADTEPINPIAPGVLLAAHRAAARGGTQ